MSTFFSGTDQSTLIEQAQLKDFFLSIIVNNIKKYSAKVSYLVEDSIDCVKERIIKNYDTGEDTLLQIPIQTTEKFVGIHECEFVNMDIIPAVNEELDSVIERLKRSKIKSVPTPIYGNYNNNYANYGGSSYKANPKPVEISTNAILNGSSHPAILPKSQTVFKSDCKNDYKKFIANGLQLSLFCDVTIEQALKNIPTSTTLPDYVRMLEINIENNLEYSFDFDGSFEMANRILKQVNNILKPFYENEFVFNFCVVLENYLSGFVEEEENPFNEQHQLDQDFINQLEKDNQ